MRLLSDTSDAVWLGVVWCGVLCVTFCGVVCRVVCDFLCCGVWCGVGDCSVGEWCGVAGFDLFIHILQRMGRRKGMEIEQELQS